MGSLWHNVKLVGLSLLAIYSASVFLIFLTLQRNKPFTSELPDGRCEAFFSHAQDLNRNEDTSNSTVTDM